MSKESVRLFYDALTKESGLQERFREQSARCAEELKGDLSEEERMEVLFLKRLLPVAREMGFDFSYADLKEYAKEASAGELADEELAAVVGGGNVCSCFMYGSGNGKSPNGGAAQFVCLLVGQVEAGNLTCSCPLVGSGSIAT